MQHSANRRPQSSAVSTTSAALLASMSSHASWWSAQPVIPGAPDPPEHDPIPRCPAITLRFSQSRLLADVRLSVLLKGPDGSSWSPHPSSKPSENLRKACSAST